MATWTPPERPDWVTRINDEGAGIDSRGIVPLDERSLLDTATANTGLSDFGDDDWREPFQVFISSLEQEADLNLMGRIWARCEILIWLEARLQVEDTYKRHPEINDERIVQPVIIVGQGRSGTSLLHNTLAANPDNGAPLHWEHLYPCPPPEAATYYTDPRIEKARKVVDIWNRVTPSMWSVHPMATDMPFEDCLFMSHTFRSTVYMDCLGQVPSFDAHMMEQDITPLLDYHERFLKLLQWRNPRKHWILKDVAHLDRIEALLAKYPDALFVWTHRDPVRALASLVSTVGTIQYGRCDDPLRGDSMTFMTDPNILASRFDAAIDVIDSGRVPDTQFHNLHYKDLVADTLGTIEKMYDHFGIELTEHGRAGMAKHLGENPRDNRPKHLFSPGTDDDIAAAHKAFARYQTRFDVPVE